MYQHILDFWFKEIDPALWWKKDPAFDQLITGRFSTIHQQAVACELYDWRQNPQGRLAEIIILDQFSRNMFRDSPLSYTYDAMALVLAQEAVAISADQKLNAVQRSFLYMPYMHSESLAIHEAAMILYKKNGIESNYQFELKHKQIIERFGRYPHRNQILNRQSTAEEIDFLNQEGSSF